jgi:hypothetical protein
VFLKLWIPLVAEHQKAVPLPPPDVIDSMDLYEVGEVLNIKVHNRSLRYYICWKATRRSTLGNPDTTWWVPRVL